jgi:hypothetical protein
LSIADSFFGLFRGKSFDMPGGQLADQIRQFDEHFVLVQFAERAEERLPEVATISSRENRHLESAFRRERRKLVEGILKNGADPLPGFGRRKAAGLLDESQQVRRQDAVRQEP